MSFSHSFLFAWPRIRKKLNDGRSFVVIIKNALIDWLGDWANQVVTGRVDTTTIRIFHTSSFAKFNATVAGTTSHCCCTAIVQTTFTTSWACPTDFSAAALRCCLDKIKQHRTASRQKEEYDYSHRLESSLNHHNSQIHFYNWSFAMVNSIVCCLCHCRRLPGRYPVDTENWRCTPLRATVDFHGPNHCREWQP